MMAGYNNSNNNLERMSEEELGNYYANPTNYSNILQELGLDSISDATLPIGDSCDMQQLIGSLLAALESRELNLGTGPSNQHVPQFEQDPNRPLINRSNVRTAVPAQKRRSKGKRVSLSHSMDVNQSQLLISLSRQLAIEHELEEFYRPRYKSDYFAQNETVRLPRYVTDRLGNHFVTLRVPIGVSGVIRVDWLTVPNEHGDRYWMPYKFQVNNQRADIPDCNPMYVDITADRSGTMKLYLVLIKSKQAELRTLQSLKPFQPYRDALGASTKPYVHSSAPMNPKELIEKYQLEKSQLAFTFCSVNADRSSCIPEWDTTTYSTVLTEIQTSSSKRKAIVCPHCEYVFQLPTAMETDEVDDDEITADIQLTGLGKRKNKRKMTDKAQCNE